MSTVWYIYSIHCIHCTNTRIGWYPAIRSKSSQGKSTKTLTWKTLRTIPGVALGTDYRLFQPSRFRSRNIIYQTAPNWETRRKWKFNNFQTTFTFQTIFRTFETLLELKVYSSLGRKLTNCLSGLDSWGSGLDNWGSGLNSWGSRFDSLETKC